MSALERIIDAEVVEDITETTKRQEYVRGLRMVADLLEAHPEVETPNGFGESKWSPVTWFAGSVGAAAAVQRAIGGRWEKNDPNESDYASEHLVLIRKLGEELNIRIIVSREKICEKTVVGTERKTVRKLVSAAVYADVEEDVDKVEIKCGSLLSAADQAALEKL